MRFLQVLLLLFLLALSTFVNGQQSTTLWPAGIDYTLTYAEDLNIEFFNASLSQKSLPMVFNVTELNNTGYKYAIQGNVSTEYSVKMDIIQIPNLGAFEVPVGDLPLFLPLSFNGKEDWMDSFGSQLQTLGALINNFNGTIIVGSNITITNEEIIFALSASFDNISMTQINQNFENYLQFLPVDIFTSQNYTLFEASILTNFTYSKSSGILQNFEVKITSANVTDLLTNYSNPIIYQALTFVAVLPPFGSSGLFESPFQLLPLVIILPVLASRLRKKSLFQT